MTRRRAQAQRRRVLAAPSRGVVLSLRAPNTIGEHARKARKDAGLTLGEMARRLGVTVAQLSDAELFSHGLGLEFRQCVACRHGAELMAHDACGPALCFVCREARGCGGERALMALQAWEAAR